ncbi:hypothetical protein K505DRAFT_3522 [Melanomma pulvis-pyrius CBS 109.77]|uniref:Uncharacterized protein n=1 Tax=Melanomma pulvis-pyrius CBS 109.77 TaxID=1314802 RepID=A0A6A6XIU4_9PLEO|nr:hypothetical protein K505DRAFT_3522 [Melanomma pulvis-pyrius CBS 109.77]
MAHAWDRAGVLAGPPAPQFPSSESRLASSPLATAIALEITRVQGLWYSRRAVHVCLEVLSTEGMNIEYTVRREGGVGVPKGVWPRLRESPRSARCTIALCSRRASPHQCCLCLPCCGHRGRWRRRRRVHVGPWCPRFPFSPTATWSREGRRSPGCGHRREGLGRVGRLGHVTPP